jgi:hypothetical protein
VSSDWLRISSRNVSLRASRIVSLRIVAPKSFRHWC